MDKNMLYNAYGMMRETWEVIKLSINVRDTQL